MASGVPIEEKPLPSNVDENKLVAQIEASLRAETPEESLRELVYQWFRVEGLDEGEALGVLHRFFYRNLRSDDREDDYNVVADTMDAISGWGVQPGAVIRRYR